MTQLRQSMAGAIAFALAVSISCACAAEGGGPGGPVVSVTRVQGVPTFAVDGKPFLSPAFETYVPEVRYFQQFAAAGTRLYSFNTNVSACDYGHSLPTWIDADTWDYAQFDELMRRVLEARPDALVMPRVNLGTPRWWLEAHPESLEQFEDGATRFDPARISVTLPKDRPFPSLASPVWREAQADALRRFLAHVEAAGFGPHIFGYMLTGLHTEEWYHWSAGSDLCAGYSAPTIAAYRAWLKEKYGKDEKLRAAWKQPDASIANAMPPSCAERQDGATGTLRDADTVNPLVDFLTFWNELIPDTIDYFARVAREETKGRKALGAFYGYQYEFDGDPEFGHNALGRYLECDSLDYLMVTASYFNREAATGADYQRSPAHSVALHGKVWYHDNDTISFLAPKIHGLDQPGKENDPYWGQLRLLGYTPTAEESRWMFRRSLGFALCTGLYGNFFDLHGGYFNDPALMEEIGGLTRLAESVAARDRSSVAEVLVVADEPSCYYVTHKNPILRQSLQGPQRALAQLGAPVDQVLLSDLDRVDASRYKLVIFLNAYHVSPADRRLVARRLERQGRWILWCYAPGFYGGTSTQGGMEDLTGMTVVRDPDSPADALRMEFMGGDDALAAQLHEATPAPCGAGATGVEGMRVDDAIPLARHPVGHAVNMAYKPMKTWTSVYAISPDLPAAAFAALARAAGVHCYNAPGDTLYVNRSMITVHAHDDGVRTLQFPEAVNVSDALNEKYFGRSVTSCVVPMKKGETALLSWEPARP